jgi:hypothetical protein
MSDYDDGWNEGFEFGRAKLQAVVDAAKGLVALLEETEETDDGREFHPVTISSCRVHKTALIAEYLKAIKEVESE